jgi:hypothetical protein
VVEKVSGLFDIANCFHTHKHPAFGLDETESYPDQVCLSNYFLIPICLPTVCHGNFITLGVPPTCHCTSIRCSMPPSLPDNSRSTICSWPPCLTTFDQIIVLSHPSTNPLEIQELVILIVDVDTLVTVYRNLLVQTPSLIWSIEW